MRRFTGVGFEGAVGDEGLDGKNEIKMHTYESEAFRRGLTNTLVV